MSSFRVSDCKTGGYLLVDDHNRRGRGKHLLWIVKKQIIQKPDQHPLGGRVNLLLQDPMKQIVSKCVFSFADGRFYIKNKNSERGYSKVDFKVIRGVKRSQLERYAQYLGK